MFEVIASASSRHFVGSDVSDIDMERTQIYYLVKTSSETSI